MKHLLLLSCVSVALLLSSAGGAARSNPVKGWMTTADGSQRLVPMTGISEGEASPASTEIAVDTSQRFQTMEGFGASITDASAWLLQTKMTPKARADLLKELFGPQGAGFSVTRITVGASDFSQSHYTYADTPGNPVADITQAKAHLLPTLRAMRTINPRLKIIATPWSAPAWMKDSGSLVKGRLKPASYADFSRYLVSYAKAMRRAGAPIDILTIQNEPHFEPVDYPGMRVEPKERADLIGNHLGPLMQKELPKTRLLDWDHNWDQSESPVAVLSDPKAAQYIDGVAWHCYAGDVKAQSVVRDRFPDKEVWFTECASGAWSPDWDKSFAWSMRTLIIGTTRNWARGVVMWNLALDENNGPHLGGCGNCRGLVTIDSKTGAVTREPEYYAFAHASRFVRAGAVRVASDSGLAAIESVAFQHGKRGKIAMIVRNGSNAEKEISVRQGKRVFKAKMPAGAVATFTWQPG